MFNNNNPYSLDTLLSESLVYEGSNWNSKKIRNLNESQKIKLSDRIAAEILSSLREKMKEPDYKDIEKTKGDFSKFKGFSDIHQVSGLLKKISDSDINSTVDFKNAINIVINSINFLLSEKNQFMKAFQKGNQIIICIYDATVIGIVEAIAMILTTCVTVETNNFNFVIKSNSSYKKNVTDSRIFKSLQGVLKTYENKKINKVFNIEKGDIENIVKKEDFSDLGKSTKIVTGIAVGIITFAIIIALLYNARHIVFFFYSSKIKLSEHLEKTAEMTRLNTISLGNDEKSEKIREKQLKYVEKLNKYAEKLRVDNNLAEQKADREIKEQDKQLGSDDSLTSDDAILI